ncbi:MAG TPA: 6-phosphofructokinase [Anaerolineales bacterium]|nr:6-phosphofructokinase [Anaerolineales bacterium]HRQ91694.1 6-phosphofructokinase [Anaerolineales bacterium]
MAEIKRIAVLTSGGDAPGMNTCIRAVVRTALYNGCDVFGIRDGYEGLLRNDMALLEAREVGGIIQRGGTILGTARSDEFRTEAGQAKGMQILKSHNIDALVVIGGDGSMRGARALVKLGLPVVGVPATIDNDMWGTNMAIGVDTALNTISDAIDKLRDTASSHRRAFLIETMGRNCGYLAVMAGVIGGAEVVLIPEAPVTIEEVAAKVEDAYKRGKTHSIVIVSEGANVLTTELASALEQMDVGFSTRITILGHIQRGGRPTAFDRLLASRMGVTAVDALLAGQTDVMMGLRGREVEPVPLADVVSKQREANLDYYEMAKMLAF